MSWTQYLNMQLDSALLSQDELIDLKVIEEIKKYPCIWDCDHPDYGKKHIIRDTWDIIENELDMKVDNCKARWKRARDRLRTKLKTAMVKQGMDPQDNQVPTSSLWPLFPALTFIITGKLINKWVYSNTNDDIENNFNINDFIDTIPPPKSPAVEVISDNENVTINSSPLSRTNSKRKRPFSSKTNDELIEVEEENLAAFQENAESNIDSDYLFLMSLLPSFKQFSDKTKMKLKIKIQKIIYDELTESK